MNTATRSHSESTAAARIQSWWSIADLPECYPASSDDVAELLRAVGYDVDRERLEGLAWRGVMDAPQRIGKRLLWMATDVVRAAQALEGRRQWQPDSPHHRHKLCSTELLAAETPEENQDAFFAENKWTADDYIRAMVHCPDGNTRAAFAVCLRYLLAAEGVNVR